MHRLVPTGRSAAVCSLWLVVMLALGCGDGVIGPSEPLDDAARDARVPGSDARVTRPSDAGEAAPEDPPPDADAGVAPGSGGSCGDVQAADHPPFAAIKKLATTDDEVRVLVYGQSISEQDWWEKTKRWLEQTYPRGKLVMEEHARGGCASQCLIGQVPWGVDGAQRNRLPEDVFAWKPDLVIFHVYGDHKDYQYLMEGLKTGCAAFDEYTSSTGQRVPEVRCTDAQRAMSQGYQAPEVLVQNDFVNQTEPTSCPDAPTAANWDCYMNEKIIPEAVAEHGYALQDNFHAWETEARTMGVDPRSTILPPPDGIHLSESGNDVMFNLTVPHLCYAP